MSAKSSRIGVVLVDGYAFIKRRDGHINTDAGRFTQLVRDIESEMRARLRGVEDFMVHPQGLVVFFPDPEDGKEKGVMSQTRCSENHSLIKALEHEVTPRWRVVRSLFKRGGGTDNRWVASVEDVKLAAEAARLAQTDALDPFGCTTAKQTATDIFVVTGDRDHEPTVTATTNGALRWCVLINDCRRLEQVQQQTGRLIDYRRQLAASHSSVVMQPPPPAGTYVPGNSSNGRGSAGGGHGSSIICNICQERGHIARECPENCCFHCGAPGHFAAECPNSRGRGGGGGGGGGGRNDHHHHQPSQRPVIVADAPIHNGNREVVICAAHWNGSGVVGAPGCPLGSHCEFQHRNRASNDVCLDYLSDHRNCTRGAQCTKAHVRLAFPAAASKRKSKAEMRRIARERVEAEFAELIENEATARQAAAAASSSSAASTPTAAARNAAASSLGGALAPPPPLLQPPPPPPPSSAAALALRAAEEAKKAQAHKEEQRQRVRAQLSQYMNDAVGSDEDSNDTPVGGGGGSQKYFESDAELARRLAQEEQEAAAAEAANAAGGRGRTRGRGRARGGNATGTAGVVAVAASARTPTQQAAAASSGSRNGNGAFTGEGGDDTYACGACTYINKSTLPSCEICGTPRTPAVDLAATLEDPPAAAAAFTDSNAMQDGQDATTTTTAAPAPPLQHAAAVEADPVLLARLNRELMADPEKARIALIRTNNNFREAASLVWDL